MDTRSIRRARARLASRRGLALAGAGALALTLVTPGAASAHHAASLAARNDAHCISGATATAARSAASPRTTAACPPNSRTGCLTEAWKV